MVLAEVLVEKENLEKKIEQLERYLYRVSGVSADQTNKATEKLLELIDKHRSHRIMINRINNSIEVTIGGSKVSLADAVLITQTMSRKIDLLDDLISCCDADTALDLFGLADQRDKLLEEYTVLSNQLQSIEWSTKVD